MVTQVIILNDKITGKVRIHLETYQSSLGREGRYQNSGTYTKDKG